MHWKVIWLATSIANIAVQVTLNPVDVAVYTMQVSKQRGLMDLYRSYNVTSATSTVKL